VFYHNFPLPRQGHLALPFFVFAGFAFCEQMLLRNLQILFSGTNTSEAKSSFGSFLLKDNNIFRKICSLLSPTRRMIKRLTAMAAATRNTLAQVLKILYLSENQLLLSKNDRLLFLVC
jgi:hypothetical protein